MPNSKQRSWYEAALARAHRAVWNAQLAADEFGDMGAADDLTQILQHLQVLMDDSLKNKRHTPQLAS